MEVSNVRTGIDAIADLSAQVCVVGSGPVGLAIAVDLARRGHAVVLIESGANALEAVRAGNQASESEH